jgi:hypothetical protein
MRLPNSACRSWLLAGAAASALVGAGPSHVWAQPEPGGIIWFETEAERRSPARTYYRSDLTGTIIPARHTEPPYDPSNSQHRLTTASALGRDQNAQLNEEILYESQQFANNTGVLAEIRSYQNSMAHRAVTEVGAVLTQTGSIGKELRDEYFDSYANIAESEARMAGIGTVFQRVRGRLTREGLTAFTRMLEGEQDNIDYHRDQLRRYDKTLSDAVLIDVASLGLARLGSYIGTAVTRARTATQRTATAAEAEAQRRAVSSATAGTEAAGERVVGAAERHLAVTEANEQVARAATGYNAKKAANDAAEATLIQAQENLARAEATAAARRASAQEAQAAAQQAEVQVARANGQAAATRTASARAGQAADAAEEAARRAGDALDSARSQLDEARRALTEFERNTAPRLRAAADEAGRRMRDLRQTSRQLGLARDVARENVSRAATGDKPAARRVFEEAEARARQAADALEAARLEWNRLGKDGAAGVIGPQRQQLSGEVARAQTAEAAARTEATAATSRATEAGAQAELTAQAAAAAAAEAKASQAAVETSRREAVAATEAARRAEAEAQAAVRSAAESQQVAQATRRTLTDALDEVGRAADAAKAELQRAVRAEILAQREAGTELGRAASDVAAAHQQQAAAAGRTSTGRAGVTDQALRDALTRQRAAEEALRAATQRLEATQAKLATLDEARAFVLGFKQWSLTEVGGSRVAGLAADLVVATFSNVLTDSQPAADWWRTAYDYWHAKLTPDERRELAAALEGAPPDVRAGLERIQTAGATAPVESRTQTGTASVDSSRPAGAAEPRQRASRDEGARKAAAAGADPKPAEPRLIPAATGGEAQPAREPTTGTPPVTPPKQDEIQKSQTGALLFKGGGDVMQVAAGLGFDFSSVIPSIDFEFGPGESPGPSPRVATGPSSELTEEERLLRLGAIAALRTDQATTSGSEVQQPFPTRPNAALQAAADVDQRVGELERQRRERERQSDRPVSDATAGQVGATPQVVTPAEPSPGEPSPDEPTVNDPPAEPATSVLEAGTTPQVVSPPAPPVLTVASVDPPPQAPLSTTPAQNAWVGAWRLLDPEAGVSQVVITSEGAGRLVLSGLGQPIALEGDGQTYHGAGATLFGVGDHQITLSRRGGTRTLEARHANGGQWSTALSGP